MLENIELLYSTFIIIFDLDNVCTAKDLYIVEIVVQIYSSLVQPIDLLGTAHKIHYMD